MGRAVKYSLCKKSGKTGMEHFDILFYAKKVVKLVWSTLIYYFMPKHLNLVDKPSNVSLTSTYAL